MCSAAPVALSPVQSAHIATLVQAAAGPEVARHMHLLAASRVPPSFLPFFSSLVVLMPLVQPALAVVSGGTIGLVAEPLPPPTLLATGASCHCPIGPRGV
jgi:hypothetical protein